MHYYRGLNTSTMLINDPENPPLFRPVTYNGISAAASETRVEIRGNSGSDVRVIKMNTSADGLVEFEVRSGEEIPFRYRRD